MLSQKYHKLILIDRRIIFLNLLGVVLMLVTAVLVYMWFDTTPPYVFDASGSEIIPKKVEAGMQIRVDWKVKFNRICTGTNIRELFDPVTNARLAVYDPVPTASSAALERGNHLIRTFLLPRRLPPGPVGYRAHLVYKCNWLQNFFPIEMDTPDLFFELIDGDNK